MILLYGVQCFQKRYMCDHGTDSYNFAAVASAIQLARKRRQRRALLVHRDGVIKKENFSQPIFEVDNPNSSNGSLDQSSQPLPPIVPTVQV